MVNHVKVAKMNPIDRLSDLPDPIIDHIFSYLDMRLVVQTSTLATRWRNIWASTPCLNFDFTLSTNDPSKLSSLDKDKRRSFTKLVDRVLICRDASNIHKFSLSSKAALNGDRLHTWLMGPLKRNVNEIYLVAGSHQSIELPPRVFSSEITILTLCFRSGRGEMQLPNTICSAAKLKRLKLEYVKLPNGNCNGELVVSCPSLIYLNMLSCDDSHLKFFTISSLLLESLEFVNEQYYKKSSCKINICSPNLISFSFFCSGYLDLSLVDLPSLVNADITTSRLGEMEADVHEKLLTKLLRGIHNVHALKLAGETLKAITDSPNILEKLPSLFRNLRDITVEDGGDEDGMTSIGAMANMLKILPPIQTFIWDRAKCGCRNERGEELLASGIFQCLETVEIRDPHELEDEIKFIKSLLERALCLKKLTITVTKETRFSKNFRQKLLALPWASANALLHFP